jgi:hypothetical protein
MARASRVALFEREVRERLTASAVELLFARARLLSEGRRSDSPALGPAFFGTVMLTIELAELAPLLREALDEAAAQRIAEMMAADARVLGRVRRLATDEAARLAGAPLKVHSADVRVRAAGCRIHVDVELEG